MAARFPFSPAATFNVCSLLFEDVRHSVQEVNGTVKQVHSLPQKEKHTRRKEIAASLNDAKRQIQLQLMLTKQCLSFCKVLLASAPASSQLNSIIGNCHRMLADIYQFKTRMKVLKRNTWSDQRLPSTASFQKPLAGVKRDRKIKKHQEAAKSAEKRALRQQASNSLFDANQDRRTNIVGQSEMGIRLLPS